MRALFDQIEQAMLPHTLDYKARAKFNQLCNEAEKEMSTAVTNAAQCRDWDRLHQKNMDYIAELEGQLREAKAIPYSPTVSGPHVVNGFEPYEQGLEE